MPPARSPSEIRPTWYAGPSSALGELWTMLHLPYTMMVLSFAAAGALLAPSISWDLLSGTLVAYFLGLGMGAHFLDQVPGMGSRYVHHWPTSLLWVTGLAALGGAIALGVVAALWFVGLPLLALVAVQTACALGYPLARWFGGVLHRDSVFAFSWGTLPFLTSFYAQSRSITLESLAIAALFAGVSFGEIRLSRRSRELRVASRSKTGLPGAGPLPKGGPYRRFDRALQALSLSTVGVIWVLLGSRVAMMLRW